MAVPVMALGQEEEIVSSRGNTREYSIVDVPVWNVGDAWHVEEYITQDDGTTMDIDRWFNVTQVTNEGSNEVYKLSFEGSIVIDMTLLVLISTSYTGYYMFRTSDLALVKVYELGTGYYQGDPTSSWTITESFTHDPPEEDYDFPLGRTDETWKVDTYGNGTSSYTDSFGTNLNNPINKHLVMDYTCAGVVSQTVPAGTFDCLQAHAVISGGGTDDHYYNSTVGWDVYRIATNYGGISSAWTKLVSYSRAGQAAIVTVQLDPDQADYGGSFTVNGVAKKQSDQTPIVGASVQIEIPNSGVSSQNVNTGAGGVFTANFNAPLLDDRTPCNKDKGSWGVLAKVGGSDQGWAAASITLVTIPKPDLSITDTDITDDLGGLTPFVGMEIQLSAKVSNVGSVTAATVNVSFYDDTTYLGSKTLTDITAASYKTATWDWTPSTPP